MFISQEHYDRLNSRLDEKDKVIYELREQIEKLTPKKECANCHCMTSFIPTKNTKYCGACMYTAQSMVIA